MSGMLGSFMSQRSVIGLFATEDYAADALDSLTEAGFTQGEFEVLTGIPYPEGTFGEAEPIHRLFRFPLFGAAVGFTLGLVATVATQLAFPMVTGGKPILSIPPMAIIMYEFTLLFSILFTVIGIIFESRLPRLFMGAYDTRITEGYVGVAVTVGEERIGAAEDVLKGSGAEDVKRSWEED